MKAFSIALGILLFLLLGFLHLNQAQEFDSVILEEDRKPFTIVDQIPDPVQLQSFLNLLEPKNPGERAELVEAFLGAYPQSAFLAQVYEIAAKSYIDLGDYARALILGRASLKILPENLLLLVPLANVQVHQGLITEAKQNAREALANLERFGRPIAIPKQMWPDLERRLKASSYYVLGRAAVSEALEVHLSQRRAELLQKSEKFLSRAWSLNPADPEIAYLRGLSHLWSGKPKEAARSFAAVYRLKGAMQSQAFRELHAIYELSRGNSKMSFEAFLEELEAKPPDFASYSPSQSSPPPNLLSDYAGTESCRMCHIDQYSAWSKTGMARMFRPYHGKTLSAISNRTTSIMPATKFDGRALRLK